MKTNNIRRNRRPFVFIATASVVIVALVATTRQANAGGFSLAINNGHTSFGLSIGDVGNGIYVAPTYAEPLSVPIARPDMRPPIPPRHDPRFAPRPVPRPEPRFAPRPAPRPDPRFRPDPINNVPRHPGGIRADAPRHMPGGPRR